MSYALINTIIACAFFIILVISTSKISSLDDEITSLKIQNMRYMAEATNAQRLLDKNVKYMLDNGFIKETNTIEIDGKSYKKLTNDELKAQIEKKEDAN